MNIREKMRRNAAVHLSPGESVQAVISAQVFMPNNLIRATQSLISGIPYRVVVVTDRRILVCLSGKMHNATAVSVERDLPRNTRIGPAKGLWYYCTHLGEPHLYVNHRFHRDIAIADELLDGAPGEPAPD